MAWVRIDDQAPRNAKMLKAGPAACWLWVCGIAHCQSQLTDGFIALEALPMIGIAGPARVKRLAEDLVEAGLFDRADGGYKVHDYLEHNTSRTVVLAKRAEDSARKHRTESIGNPRGIQPESAAPRARVPSHPIPSDPIQDGPDDRARPRRSNGSGAMAGGLQREHLKHAVCDDTFSRCVPDAVHAKLLNLLAPKYAGDRGTADQALRAWYPTVWATLAPTFVMGDAFKFWQGRFDAEFATPDASRSAGKLTSRLMQAVANIKREADR